MAGEGKQEMDGVRQDKRRGHRREDEGAGRCGGMKRRGGERNEDDRAQSESLGVQEPSLAGACNTARDFVLLSGIRRFTSTGSEAIVVFSHSELQARLP